MNQVDCVKILLDKVCRCGRGKLARQAFCRRCYWRVGTFTRHALDSPVGAGFAEAYDQAIRELGFEVNR